MSFETIRIGEVESYIRREDIRIIDVRNKIDFNRGHIENAVNIPYEELEQNKSILDGYQSILLYCDRGNSSLLAARDLNKVGYSVINLCGGLRAYRGKLVK